MAKAKCSSLHNIYDKEESIKCHLVSPSKVRFKSTSRNSRIVGSRQTPIRRSPRFLSSDKLKSEISSHLSTLRKKSVETPPGSSSISSKWKQKDPYKMPRQEVPAKSQLKLSRTNSCEHLEEAQNGCRRSSRLDSKTRRTAFESQQLFPVQSRRRESLRLLGIAPIYSKDEKQGINNSKASNEVEYNNLQEVDCKFVNSQIVRRSSRLVSVPARPGIETNGPEAILKSNPEKSPKKDLVFMSSQPRIQPRRLTTKSNGGMERGVTLNITDKGNVDERLNADRGDLDSEKRIGDDLLNIKTQEIHKDKRKLEENNGVENLIRKVENAEFHVTVAWTDDQEEALQRAYLMAKPSPHFWKKISRMVPGKSAQDCFDKIHASILTPLSSQLQSKTRRKSFSPICNFSLSGIFSPQVSKLAPRRHGRTQKLAAQKTVRHLLRKHRITDHEKEIDRFSLLESSPVNITSNVTDIRLPETSCSSNSPSHLPQPGVKLPPSSKILSRFKLLTSPNNPSPEVLKMIKNRALHDRYIDVLHHREAKRVILAKKINSGVVFKSEHGDLKAARTALITDAVSFINQFRESKANPMHELEVGEDDDYYYDDGDFDDDDVDE